MVDTESPNEVTRSLSRSIQSEGMSVKDRVGRSILATFIAALGPLCFGYAIGYSSSALEDLQNANASSAVRLTSNQGSWFSSLVTVGAALGSPLGGWAIGRFGRKGAIILCAIPFDLGWLLISYGQNRAMLYAGRIITGVGVGTISLAVPVYIAEVVPARLRGMLGSVNQFAIAVGLILVYGIGVVCKWRWLAFIGTIPATLLLVLMCFMPETPRWLLEKNRTNDALKTLLWLRGSDADIEEECSKIEETLGHHEKLSPRDVLSPTIAKPLIISVGLMIFQQFSGINAVLFNSASIFATAGFSNGKLVSITNGLVQFVGSGLACLIMDKAGRRILLLIGGIGLCVSLLGLGIYFQIYIPPEDGSSSNDTLSMLGSISHSVPAKTISWLSILCVVLLNFLFSMTWGPIPWIIMSEIFPLRARGPASGFATITNWTSAFIVTLTYDAMAASLTLQGVFWFYAGCCFLAFTFVYFLLPETKGKTLEEIEAMFDKDRRGYQQIE